MWTRGPYACAMPPVGRGRKRYCRSIESVEHHAHASVGGRPIAQDLPMAGRHGDVGERLQAVTDQVGATDADVGQEELGAVLREEARPEQARERELEPVRIPEEAP